MVTTTLNWDELHNLVPTFRGGDLVVARQTRVERARIALAYTPGSKLGFVLAWWTKYDSNTGQWHYRADAPTTLETSISNGVHRSGELLTCNTPDGQHLTLLPASSPDRLTPAEVVGLPPAAVRLQTGILRKRVPLLGDLLRQVCLRQTRFTRYLPRFQQVEYFPTSDILTVLDDTDAEAFLQAYLRLYQNSYRLDEDIVMPVY